MDFSVITKGIILHFFYNIVVVMFLTSYQFELTEKQFTLILLGGLLCISIYIGKSTTKAPEVHGFFVGIGAAILLIVFLSQFVKTDRELNFLLMAIWSFFSFFGAIIGSKLKRKKNT